MRDVLIRNFEITDDTILTMHVSSLTYTIVGNWIVEIDNIIRLPGEEHVKQVPGFNLRYDLKVRFVRPLSIESQNAETNIDSDPRIKQGKFVHVEYSEPVL